MLKMTLTHAGRCSQVELNGQDISRFLSKVEVVASVDGMTSAKLHYNGAVVVEGEVGILELVQAPHFVQCTDCQKTVSGEAKPTLVRTTSVGHASEERQLAVKGD